MGRFDGRVVLITGAAGGIGRAHAELFHREGARVVAVDLPGPGLDELGGIAVDVRDKAALRDALSGLDRLDAVIAAAGILDYAAWPDVTDEHWQRTLDINLTGVWHTCQVAAPHIIDGGRGGSIVVLNSRCGLQASANVLAYGTSKHALVGLVRSLANALGEHGIRVNSIHPTMVDTPMIQDEATWAMASPDDPSRAGAAAVFQKRHALPIPWVEPVDVANASLFLCSDEARYITGVTLPVDAGYLIR